MTKRTVNDNNNKDEDVPSHASKRSKPSGEQSLMALTTSNRTANNQQLTFLPIHQRKIKSNLAAPEISLVGHDAAVYSISFDPTGNYLCSASMDRSIC
jgi:WD40 repeat protein